MEPPVAVARPSRSLMVVVFPEPFGSQEAEDRAFRHGQIDAVDSQLLAEPFGQPPGLDAQLDTQLGPRPGGAHAAVTGGSPDRRRIPRP